MPLDSQSPHECKQPNPKANCIPAATIKPGPSRASELQIGLLGPVNQSCQKLWIRQSIATPSKGTLSWFAVVRS